jgi:hypothetical protein
MLCAMKRDLSSAQRRRRAAVLAALDEQLNSSDTPQVREHYQRLRALGRPDDDVRELMATVLVFYLSHSARGDNYTYEDYVAELGRLPQIDWRDDEEQD